jgi:hypothetical protein
MAIFGEELQLVTASMAKNALIFFPKSKQAFSVQLDV